MTAKADYAVAYAPTAGFMSSDLTDVETVARSKWRAASLRGPLFASLNFLFRCSMMVYTRNNDVDVLSYAESLSVPEVSSSILRKHPWRAKQARTTGCSID